MTRHNTTPTHEHLALERVTAYLDGLDGFYSEDEKPDDVLDYVDGSPTSPPLRLSDLRILAARGNNTTHEQEIAEAERDDERAARKIAGEAADRFRDVLSECLGHPDENPGDDTLVAEVRAHFGKTGPEPRRWRNFLTGALAQVDQIAAVRAALSPAPTNEARGGNTDNTPCPFCQSDPDALADAHQEGWQAGREVGRNERDAAPAPTETARCPGCGHACCPTPGLECGGESDQVAHCGWSWLCAAPAPSCECPTDDYCPRCHPRWHARLAARGNNTTHETLPAAILAGEPTAETLAGKSQAWVRGERHGRHIAAERVRAALSPAPTNEDDARYPRDTDFPAVDAPRIEDTAASEGETNP